jgi:hypothetical protein
MRSWLGLLVVMSTACSFLSKPPVQQPQPAAEAAPPPPPKPANEADAQRQATVREHLQLEVTDLTGVPIENAFSPAQAMAVARLDLIPAGDGYEARVVFTEPVRRPFAGGTLECTLEAAPATVPVAPSPEPATKIRVTAAAKSCALSEPCPEKFRVADHVLAAELESFSPVGGAYVELKNLSGKPLTVSSATVTYFDQVASRSKLSTEIPPHAAKTVTVSTAFHKQLPLPAGPSDSPSYKFGLSFTYSTTGATDETLSGNEDVTPFDRPTKR